MDILTFFYSIFWTIGLTLMGNSVLKSFGLKELEGFQKITISYWLGYVIYGTWLFIPGAIGSLNETQAFLPFILAIPALIFHKKRKKRLHWSFKGHEWSLLFIALAFINLAGGVAPPSEADSLNYHFELPKLYTETGGIVFQAHAIGYASTFLSQMVSTGSYILGGEQMMTLHAWWSSLMAGLAAYALARRRLRAAPSWLFAALIYSVPALTYGATSGTVEPRLMGVITAAALSLVYYARSEKIAWLVILSILLGGAMGMKYFALFAVAAFGLALIFVVKIFPLKKGLAHLIIFGILTLVFGAEWYWWNWLHTGDPIFPSLFHFLGHSGWSAEQANYFNQHYVAGELMIERNPSNFFWHYPIEATFESVKFGHGSAGLGALFLIALVPSIFYFIKRFPFMTWNAHVGSLELYILITLVVYSLFFFIGEFGAISNLLPIIPLIVLPAWVWGQQIFARTFGFGRILMVGSISLILAIQITVATLTNKNSIALWAQYTSKEEYLQNNVQAYDFAQYINSNLTPQNKVMLTNLSTFSYYLNVPKFNANPALQEIIPLSYGSITENLNAIWREGVTHWATSENPMDINNDNFENGHHILRELIKLGCFKKAGDMEGLLKTPALFNNNVGSPITYYIYKSVPRCAG